MGVLARVMGVYATSRLVAFLAIVFGTRVTGRTGIWGALQVYDAAWYLKAASLGYPRSLPQVEGPGSQSAIAFFPLFPMTVRMVDRLTPLGTHSSGILVALCSGAVAATLLWMLAERLSGSAAVADRAVVLFCFYPATVALLLPFSEGLMMALSIGTMLALLDKRWVLAGSLAAAATTTRPTAIAVVVACGWAAVVAIKQRRELSALLAPAIAPLGIVGYFLFLWQHTGSPTAWFDVQAAGWGHGGGGPLGLDAYARMAILLEDPLVDINSVAAATALVFAVVGLGFVFWWRPPGPLIAFAISASWFAHTTGIASRPRYMLAVFPIFIALAVKVRGLPFTVLVACSAAVMAVFSIITTATDLAVF